MSRDRLTRARAIRIAAFLAAVLALVGAAGQAQEFWSGWRGWGGRSGRVLARRPTPETFDGAFHFCRIEYGSARRESGGQGWSTDYPGADINFSVRLSELTKTRVTMRPSGEPDHIVVRLTDEALFQCPFAIIEDVGTAWLTEIEVEQLRKYLLKGGFLWVDDYWGPRAWEAWLRELGKVLPPAQYPVVDVPGDHAMLHTLFEVPRVPQVPSIQFWRGSDGGTSERGPDSAEPHMRAVADEHGRLMVLMTHNTDIADSWEREGEDPDFFYRFSPEGYAFAINVLLYAMTH
jgi:hypothetical protein